MGDLKKALGYASIGAAKVAGERALRSDDYLESMISAVEAGFWVEAGRNFLKREFDRKSSPSPSGSRTPRCRR